MNLPASVANRIDLATTKHAKAVHELSAAKESLAKCLQELSKDEDQAEMVTDDLLYSALVGQIDGRHEMAKAEVARAEANVKWHISHLAQLKREAELKQAGASIRPIKAKTSADWVVKVGQDLTPVECNDGSLDTIVGRKKSVTVGMDTFCRLLGDQCIDMMNDLDGVLMQGNAAYAMTISECYDWVTLKKVL